MSFYTSADLAQVADIARWKTRDRPHVQNIAARNERRRLVRDELTYSRYVGVLAPRIIDGRAVEPDEYLPAEIDKPEDILMAIELERDIRAKLTERQKRILTALKEGFAKNDIARRERVTPAIITREVHRIQVVARLAE